MTPIMLLDGLAEFLRDKTKDLVLQVAKTSGSAESVRRPPEVFTMRLPAKEDAYKRAPYILLQPIKGVDEEEAGQGPSGTFRIRIIAVIYSDDTEGDYDILNVLLRIRSEIETQAIIARKFELQYPLEYIIYPDSTYPYFVGEMMTTWSVPRVHREVIRNVYEQKNS